MAHSPAVKTSLPQRLLRWSVNIVWLSVLTVLILVALYVGLGRQVMDNLHHFKSDIEQQVSSIVGQPVSIERIRGEWQGLDPILRVQGVALEGVDSERTVASLGELRLRLDSWASLRRLRIVLSEFVLRNGDASLVQQPDGRVGVEGIWLPPEQESEPYALPEVAAAASESFEARIGRWIGELGDVLSDPAVTVEELALHVKPAGGEASHFVVPHMDVRFESGIFRASGRLSRASNNVRTGLFALRGRHFFSGGFSGSLYLELDSGRFFDAFLRHYSWRNLTIAGIDAEAKGWFHFSDGRLSRANGRIHLPFLDMAVGGDSIEPLRNLTIRGGWERDGKGWRAQLVSNGYSWKGYETGSTALSLEDTDEGLALQAGSIELAPLGELAMASGMLPSDLHDNLVDHQPQGMVRNVRLNLPEGKPWSVTGEFQGGGVDAVDGAPRIRDLGGFFEAGPDSGRVVIEPGTVELGFPDLFTGPWTFTRLSGELRWQRRRDGWWIGSHNLAGRYRGAVAESAFGLRLRENQDDTLSLRVGISDARAAMLEALVPRQIVPDQLYRFLTRQVGEGRIPHGWYYGHGTLGDAAYPGFTSSLRYGFESTDLTYHPDWPPLRNASGQAKLQGEEATVTLSQGQVGGIELEPGRVRITPASSGVRVDVETGVRRQQRFLTEQWRRSPLPEMLGDWIRETTLYGPVAADLSMSLWPEMERAPEFDLNVDLNEAGFDFRPADLQWRNLTGSVRYGSDSGIEPTTLEGRFLDAPVTVRVEEDEDAALVVRQKGTASVEAIEEWVGRRLIGLSGSLGYEASLRPTEGPLLRLDADLERVGSSLPRPLSKRAGEAHSLTTTLDFSQDQRLVVDGNWNPLGAFQMVFAGGALERGRIALGVRSTRLPEEPVLSLTGAIPYLNLGEWSSVLDSDLGAPESASESEGSMMPDVRFNLAVERTEVAGRNMGHVRAEGESQSGSGWRIGVKGNRIDGEFILPGDEVEPIGVELSNLDIPEPSDSVDPDVPPNPDGMDVGSWPQVDASIADLRFEGRDFRNVRLLLRPGAERMVIRDLSLSMADLDLTGDLSWQPGQTPGTTEFSGTLSGGSLKGLESLLGQPVPIRNRKTRARIDFAWPGGPADLELASLEAEIGFRLENGTLEEGSDASRVFRVFGLLNTDTIWRRLQLDFSDVYESGIPFDYMEGDALIHEGRLIFDPKVVIQAPSGGFRMSGEADLIEETLDMRLVVVLPITQNLPLAAVLFGFAPPVGGALFVIDQVFGGLLSRVTSATYSVGGNWNDPAVSLRNLFDTESDLNSYERPEMDLNTGESDDPAEEIRR
ncbi:uncharacterized protein (TIGR02099 family) [Halospina denitrificans]|uniref:Uncharacterized protein (TIGR02099 family) n=1 Tax=Halospina denitrificans TaxID=332522 RepID=A0A4R7JXQ3_9GAMM|nr:AsmA-like C-terminal region-containing protein [Halospina denitrificans]TDT43252.1 uncharacterized protein (TIGR02099 family) [Halospina denitrificans]